MSRERETARPPESKYARKVRLRRLQAREEAQTLPLEIIEEPPIPAEPAPPPPTPTADGTPKAEGRIMRALPNGAAFVEADGQMYFLAARLVPSGVVLECGKAVKFKRGRKPAADQFPLALWPEFPS